MPVVAWRLREAARKGETGQQWRTMILYMRCSLGLVPLRTQELERYSCIILYIGWYMWSDMLTSLIRQY